MNGVYTSNGVYGILLIVGGERMKILKLKLDDELHKKFKLRVTEENSNMQETITKLIENYLDKVKDQQGD